VNPNGLMPADRTAQLTRATTYPYERPAGSYVLVNGRAHSLLGLGEDPLALETMLVAPFARALPRARGVQIEADEPDGQGHQDERLTLEELMARENIDQGQLTAKRTAVICYGANTAIEALTRKFERAPGDVVIPAIEASLGDFDVVFSAHISRYGAMPATLQRSAGTTVGVFVLALTEEQLEVMHATETPYRFVELTDIELTLTPARAAPSAAAPPVAAPAAPIPAAGAARPTIRTAAHTYISRNGATLVGGLEAALSAIPAMGRGYPAYSQLEMLCWLRDELAPGQGVEEFVLEHVDDPAVKEGRSEWLRASARPFTRMPEAPRTG